MSATWNRSTLSCHKVLDLSKTTINLKAGKDVCTGSDNILMGLQALFWNQYFTKLKTMRNSLRLSKFGTPFKVPNGKGLQNTAEWSTQESNQGTVASYYGDASCTCHRKVSYKAPSEQATNAEEFPSVFLRVPWLALQTDGGEEHLGSRRNF